MPKTILIVEDSEMYRQIARRSLENCRGFLIAFASSYEEAMSALRDGLFPAKWKVDAVISDLFFPSEMDWRMKMTSELPLSKQGMQSKGEFFTDWPKENPSGLAIAQWCFDNNIPFALVSQGDRHQGDLGKVRGAIIDRDFCGKDWDPLPKLLVRAGSNVDKANPSVWLEALVGVLYPDPD